MKSDGFDHIMFDNKNICFLNRNPNNDFNSLWIFNPSYNINFFKIIPQQFTISTKNLSYNFNIEMLKDTSSIISKHIEDFPDNLNFHLDIKDEKKILEKIHKLYQGEKIVIYEKDFNDFNEFLKLLKLDNIPTACRKTKRYLRSGLCPMGRFITNYHNEHYYSIIKEYFYNFISKETFQTFTIVTNKYEYKCNSFTILCSKVLYNFSLQNPTSDHYKYDLDDEYSEFQFICDFFNNQIVKITFDNFNSLKKIADDLQITPVCDYLKKYEKVMQIIEDQQLNYEATEKLLYHLYNIKNLTLSKVKEFIIDSEWSSTIEKVKELAAFILHVVKSDFSLNRVITDLLIELNNEEDNQSNKLSFLLPFIVKKLMDLFGYKKCYSLLIYNLRKKGIIPEKDISNKLREIIQKCNNYSDDIRNVIDCFLPDIYQMNKNIVYSFRDIPNEAHVSFIQSYLPNDLDKYKEMLESGEPDDKMTLILRRDDVDSLCTQLSVIKNKNDILNCSVRYNIYESFIENGKTNFLNYAAAYGSIKCFKYLLLNYFNVDDLTFRYAVNGGNIEIIRIVDQRINQRIKPIDIFQAIKKHQNNLLDWILEEKIKDIEKDSYYFDKLVKISIRSGNAHSLFKLITEGYNLFNNHLLVRISNKNGFYALSQTIFNILSINELQSFSNIAKSFVFFGNLSIFRLYDNFLNQDEFNVCFKCAVEFSFKEIIEYICQNLVMKKFQINNNKTIEEVLTISSLKNEYDLFNYLINEFLIINPRFYEEIPWMTVLLSNSCKNGKIKIVEKIVEFILKVDSTEKDITASFINAALFDFIDILKYLTNIPFIVNYEHLSASSQILKSISYDVFSLIIEKSPDNLKDTFLKNFIYPAIQNKNKGLTEYILKQNNEFENSLIEAVKSNDLEMVKLVLKYNSSSKVLNKIESNDTPLCIATKNDNLYIVQHLLSYENIDINLSDESNPNPLQIACLKNRIKICEKLLQSEKIDPNYHSLYDSGNTPLIISIIYCRWEISEMLLNHPKTKLDIKNSDNKDANSIEINSNQPKIVKMFTDKGNSNAMLQYGKMLLKGTGIEVNQEEAEKYFKMATDNGNVSAMNYYGAFLLEEKKNKEEACKYFKMAADRNNQIGLYNYGYMLEHGEGIEVNMEEAIKYFKKAAKEGCTLSMIRYGCLLMEGKKVPINEEKGVKYFRLAAQKGDPGGMCKYAYALINGIGVNVDKEEAEKYFKMAIREGFIEAALLYGYYLEKGIVFEANKEEAKKLYKMAADKGNANGINNYGWILLSTGSTNEDYEEAIKYFKKAIELGHLISLVNYGYMIDNGYGVPIDHEEASKYYEKAIEKGGTNEIFIVAEILEKGKGLPKNEKQAARLYKMAANAGHIDSMFNFAKMVENGCGIQSNKEEATQYYRMAAEGGHAEAINYVQSLSK